MMDGVAPIRMASVKRLGVSYRKPEAARSPEQELREDHGYEVKDVEMDQFGRNISKELLREMRRANYPREVNLPYQLNAKDTPPRYAYTSAITRSEKGFIPRKTRRREELDEQQSTLPPSQSLYIPERYSVTPEPEALPPVEFPQRLRGPCDSSRKDYGEV
ncbi:hypothetical protein CBS101457_002075 [Exobasidium rhododendri]|nr:hypothetical protein CBS101457_002075 [Exobasidium rhododendri]